MVYTKLSQAGHIAAARAALLVKFIPSLRQGFKLRGAFKCQVTASLETMHLPVSLQNRSKY